MKMTRRQFGLAFLGGIAALLFGPLFGWVGRRGGGEKGAPARFWTRGDHLAG